MKLLVAMDFSHSTDDLLGAVARRPWPQGSSVELIHVIDFASIAEPSLVTYVQSHVGELLDAAAAKLSVRGLHATWDILQNEPKAAIVERARAGTDLILVGSHRTKGIERFLIGSVARVVVRDAPCSVEIVRPSQRQDGGMHILLATDGSDNANNAARAIAARPWPLDTEVRILAAVELLLNTFQYSFELPAVDTESMRIAKEAAMKRAQTSIAAAEEILTESGLKTSESISVLIESPKQAILDEARDWPADLIFVGSHGYRGVDRLLLGSVSEAVATHAPCSVEVVRRKTG